MIYRLTSITASRLLALGLMSTAAVGVLVGYWQPMTSIALAVSGAAWFIGTFSQRNRSIPTPDGASGQRLRLAYVLGSIVGTLSGVVAAFLSNALLGIVAGSVIGAAFATIVALMPPRAPAGDRAMFVALTGSAAVTCAWITLIVSLLLGR